MELKTYYDFARLSLGTLEEMNPKKPFSANVSDWPERATGFCSPCSGRCFDPI